MNLVAPEISGQFWAEEAVQVEWVPGACYFLGDKLGDLVNGRAILRVITSDKKRSDRGRKKE